MNFLDQIVSLIINVIGTFLGFLSALFSLFIALINGVLSIFGF